MSEIEQGAGQGLETPVSFRQRVEDFWQLFLEHEHELRFHMDNESDLSQSYQFMSRLLLNVFTRPVFHLKTCEDHYELMVSPDGSGSRLYQIAYWRMQMPEELEEHWEIIPGVPPAENPELAVLELDGFSIAAAGVQVWPVLLADGRMGLEAYSEALLPLGPDGAYTAFCALLEQCIGELCLMSNIEYVNVLEQPALEPCIMLSDLDAWIADLQMNGQLPPQDDPLGLFTSYTMEPPEQQIYLRDDIYFGNTSAAALPVLNGYYTGEDALFDEAAREGVIWGFLFFTSADIDMEQRVNVRGAIEDDLNRVLAERGLGECVGSASGYQYAYLDCICYDWEAFMDAAEEVLEPYVQLYQISLTGFADFRKNGNMYAMQSYGGIPVGTSVEPEPDSCS